MILFLNPLAAFSGHVPNSVDGQKRTVRNWRCFYILESWRVGTFALQPVEPAGLLDLSRMDKLPETKKLPAAYRVGVYLFAVTYFSIAISTLLPKSPLQTRLSALFSPITHAFNLTQNWKLFSPDLREINFCSEAVVEFADGTTKLYEFPRLEKMDGFSRYRRQKLCKLFQDAMPWPDFSVFWPDVGRFLARANNDAANPPVQVSLSYNWISVGDIKHFEKQSDLKEPARRVTYFIYRVRPEDLK